MKKLSLLLFALCVFFWVGCEDNPAQTEEGFTTLRFSVAVPEDNGIALKEGDVVAIIDNIGVRKFKVDKVNGPVAEIVGEAEVSTKNWRLVYPYSDSIKVINGNISSWIPSVQKGDGNQVYYSIAGNQTQIFNLKPALATIEFSMEVNDFSSIVIKGLFNEGLSGRIDLGGANSSSVDSVSIIPRGGTHYITVSPVLLKQGLYLTIQKDDHSIANHRFVYNSELEAGDTINLGRIQEQDLEWHDKDSYHSYLFTPQNRAIYLKWLQSYLDVKNRSSEAVEVLTTMSSDGSWPDLNYDDPNRDKWQPADHIDRMVTLACAYYEGLGENYFAALDKSLDFWDKRNPVCLNWWYNQIGVPMSLGPGMVLIRESLNEEQTEKVLKIMRQATFGGTGTNKVWRAHNVLMTGILSEDADLMWTARNTMLEEVKITTKEGIQSDWSFLYHGNQPQIGTYGLALLNDITNISVALKGTPLEVADDKLEIIQNFALNGPYQFLWKGYYDMNACGRQVDKRRQLDKAEVMQQVMVNLGLEGAVVSGPTYYSSSDMAVYRANEWMASLRMQSNRIVGFEMTNNENMRGYFSSDGALLVRRRGDEYYNISACWNWRHVPGVTSYDDGTELYGCNTEPPYNKTDLVFGAVEEDYMAAAMEINRDGLSGRKSWFFFPKGVVCLGSGITKKGSDHVVTAVEQCRVLSEIEKAGGVIRHNNITYFPLYDTFFSVAPLEHIGEWWSINPTFTKDLEKMDILDIYVEHGVNPVNASYSYVIMADGSSMTDATDFISEQISVTSNTTNIQSVKIGDIELLVNYTNSSVEIK